MCGIERKCRHHQTAQTFLAQSDWADDVSSTYCFQKPEIVCLRCLFGVKYNNWVCRSTTACKWHSWSLFQPSTELSPFIIENWPIQSLNLSVSSFSLHLNNSPKEKRLLQPLWLHTLCVLSVLLRHQFRQCALWFGNGTLIFHSAAQLYLSTHCVWRWMRSLVLWRKESSIVNRTRRARSCLRQSSQPSDMSLSALCLNPYRCLQSREGGGRWTGCCLQESLVIVYTQLSVVHCCHLFQGVQFTPTHTLNHFPRDTAIWHRMVANPDSLLKYMDPFPIG